MAWEVIPVKHGKWAAVEFLTHWDGVPIRPVIYACASTHRSKEAAQQAADRLNAEDALATGATFPPSAGKAEGAVREAQTPKSAGLEQGRESG